MAEHVFLAVILIAIVAVVALAIADTSNSAGQAYQGNVATQHCTPTRMCAGSKLEIIKSDCSVEEAYCQSGCDSARGVCM